MMWLGAIIHDSWTSWMSWFAGRADPSEASARVRRFVDLIQATPSLRAYERDATDQLVAQTAQVLAARVGMEPEDPEPQMAAGALLELWRVQGRSLRRHLDATSTSAQIHKLVSSDVQRAARLLTDGLASFDTLKRQQPTRRRSVLTAPHSTRRTSRT